MDLTRDAPSVALLGAGSASFGLAAVAGLLRTSSLHGLELRLIDVDAEGVRSMGRLAERVSDAWGARATVRAGPDREALLRGADYVVLSVAVEREATWQRDRQIALEHGVWHYAENGGPGALFHTARNLAVLMPILRDVERLAPDALVICYTNPLPRICRAIARATDLRFVGLCHQIRFGYLVAGVALSHELGLAIPEDYAFRWTDGSIAVEDAVADALWPRLQIRAAGLNHFTWMLDVRDRRTGEDWLPRLRAGLIAGDHAGFEPLTRHLARTTGQVPVSGDTHLSEYLPFTSRREGWERFAIQAYDHAWSEGRRQAGRARVAQLAAGRGELDGLRALTSEGLEEVVAGTWHDSGAETLAVNVPNRGAIENLPDEAIVEVPGVLNRAGARGVAVGALPEPIAGWCREEARRAELAVTAALEGSRDAALAALELDPCVDGSALAARLLDAYLADHAARGQDLGWT